MPASFRAHLWTAGIFVVGVLILWLIIANPIILLWIGIILVGAAVYYVLYLLVRARFEGIDEPGENEVS